MLLSSGNTNQKDFEFLSARIPDSSKTPKALSLLLDRFEKKIERKMAKNEALISKMPDYSRSLEERSQREIQQGGMQPSGEQGQPQQREPQQEQPQQAGRQGPQPRTFKVKAPTGEIVLVPETDLDEAISHGGTVVQ